MEKEQLEFFLPSMMINTVIGKLLIKKGILTKEEIIEELSSHQKDGAVELNDAIRDAKFAVNKW